MVQHSDTRHLHITFFIDPIENPAKSRAEGRPIFEEREMVEIKFVGDPKKILAAPAHEKFTRDRASGQWVTYAQAYHRHYEAFKTGEAAKGEGTPIEELPFISAARRAELKALHVHTAEALSSLEGASLERAGMYARELRDKAKAYIEKAKGSAVEMKLVEENAELKRRLEALESKMAEPGKGTPEWEDARKKAWEMKQTRPAPEGAADRTEVQQPASEAAA
jgi:hypothetical protein